jgi:SEC-C motif-containing protein
MTDKSVKSAKLDKDGQACPCGVDLFTKCCGRYITQGEIPPIALLLMRSRYSAFVLRDEAYLQATWHPSTRPAPPILGVEPNIKWLGLEIKNQRSQDDHASVEFVARYKTNGRAQRLHEVSRFVREEGRWYYLDGSMSE